MKKKLSFIRFLPRFGSIATGMIYIFIGVIALLSLWQFRDGGADESSMMAILNDSLVGQIFIGFILIGLLCFVCWRVFEVIRYPYQYGSGKWGVTKRTAIAISSLPDLAILYTSIRILAGGSNVQLNGQPLEERALGTTLLQNSNEAWIVLALGMVYIITAGVQFLYGVTRGYRERITTQAWNPIAFHVIHIIAIAGYTARGFILGIIGFFFLKAYYLQEARHIVNTDKAFDFIGDEVGHGYFTAVAFGTICYGLFMLAMGATYNSVNAAPAKR